MEHLLIAGAERSGTTLVTRLLDAQPGITVHSDFLLAPLRAATRAGGFNVVLSPTQRRDLVESIGRQLRWHGRAFDGSTPPPHHTVRGIYVAALDTVARPRDRIVGHKVTTSALHLPMVLRDMEIACILVIRDVRDVVLSRLRLKGDEASVDWICTEWRENLDVARRYCQHPRLVVMRFEDLIARPHEALVPVEKLIGQKLELGAARVVDANGRPWIANSAFGDITALFDPRAVERWKKTESSPAVRYAGWTCRRELRAQGYPPYPPTPHRLPEALAFRLRAEISTARRRWGFFKERVLWRLHR